MHQARYLEDHQIPPAMAAVEAAPDTHVKDHHLANAARYMAGGMYCLAPFYLANQR
jgi:hypothetical protein